MQILSTPSKYLPARAYRWSWALVLACGLMLGYYVQQTYFSPKQRQYQLDFGDAQWIESPEVAPVSYFRKEVFLSAPPKQAWLEIAATDNYQLIVNGRAVGKESGVKTRVAGIYDIKKRLKAGTNVIAVSISRISYPGSAQLLVRGLIKEPGGRVTSLLSDEHWRVASHKGIVEGSEEWTSPLVDEELWPNARRSVINGRPISIAWVDTNPLLLQLPTSGSWIMAENAGSEAVFSTSINADHARQETWIQVASSGDVDLLVNGHLITPAIPSSTQGKRLPHLAIPTASPSQSSEETQPAVTAKSIEPPVETNPTASPSQNLEEKQQGGSSKESETPSKTITAPIEPAILYAYDVSYWIKKGQNTVVATVRADHRPACLFVNGFIVREDGTTARFETSSAWKIGDQSAGNQSAESQRPVEFGKDGSAPWGYLKQELARPIDHSGFATLAKSCTVILGTAIATIAVWLLVSAIAAGRRREPLARAMARDAIFHGPIAAGLALLLLPNYDLRFPAAWSFQPKFVISAVLALLAIRLLHFCANSRPAFSLKKRMARLRQTDFRTALPYLLMVAIMLLGLGLRYHNLGYMSFDHDEMGLVTKSKGIFKLGFPYTVYAGEIRWLTTYEAVPYPLALSGWIFGYSEWSMRLPAWDSLHRDHRPHGPSAFQLACRTVRRSRLRLHAAQYPVGAKRLLPVAMSVFFATDHVVVLRSNKSSSAASRVPDRCFGCLLFDLSFLGRNRLSSARLFHCVAGCSPGRMVVVKRISSLSLPLFYRCCGYRSVLLADARWRAVSYGRFGTFECCRPVALFFDARL
jgi:hypothetical protein